MLVGAYLMLNIFIAIVEEAYFLSKKKGRQLEVLMWKNIQQLAPNSVNDPNPAMMKGSDTLEPDTENDEEEWIQSLFNNSAFKIQPPLFSMDDLSITSTEQAAELYILGQSHWEYSKVWNHCVR